MTLAWKHILIQCRGHAGSNQTGASKDTGWMPVMTSGTLLDGPGRVFKVGFPKLEFESRALRQLQLWTSADRTQVEMAQSCAVVVCCMSYCPKPTLCVCARKNLFMTLYKYHRCLLLTTQLGEAPLPIWNHELVSTHPRPSNNVANAKPREKSKHFWQENASVMARRSSRNRRSVMTLTMVKASISFKALRLS